MITQLLVQQLIVFFTLLLILLGAFAFILFPWVDMIMITLYLITVGGLGFLLYYISGKTVLFNNSESSKTSSVPDESTTTINSTLYTVQSVWPFSLFPTKLIIDEKDITVMNERFFFTGSIITVPASELVNVAMYNGPFLASLTITKKMLREEIQITNLKKHEALKAKELIDAIILKQRKLIEVSDDNSLQEKKKILGDIGKNTEVRKELFSNKSS